MSAGRDGVLFPLDQSYMCVLSSIWPGNLQLVMSSFMPICMLLLKRASTATLHHIPIDQLPLAAVVRTYCIIELADCFIMGTPLLPLMALLQSGIMPAAQCPTPPSFTAGSASVQAPFVIAPLLIQ